MRHKRTDPKRRKYNNLGLIISSSYLLLTLILKGFAYKQFANALREQGIVYEQMDIRPTPFNTILWNANVDTEGRYLLGEYSFFDAKGISFRPYPKNHDLMGGLVTNEKLNRLIDITEGWYTISEDNGKLYFNDLRFGPMSLDKEERRFAFSYELENSETGLKIIETPKRPRDVNSVFKALWARIWGI